MRYFNILSFLLFVHLTVSCMAQDASPYNWNEITEVKFYGRNNPINCKDSAYVFADIEKVKDVLKYAKKSNGYFPKGAQNYATITFKNTETITIQILPGLPAPIRVVKGKLFEDDWYNLDEKNGLLWLKYIAELNEQLAD